MNNNTKPDLMADSNMNQSQNNNVGYNYEVPINTNQIKKEEKKPKKNDDDDNYGYTIGFIILVVVIVGLLGLYIWSIVSEDEEVEEEQIIEVVNYTNNILIEEIGTMDKYNDAKSVLFKITNNNTKMISATFTVTFYDNDENMVDKVESKIEAIGVKNNYYVSIDTSEEYSTYKTKITADSVDTEYTDYTSNIEEKHTVKKSGGSVEVINNTGVKMEKVSTCIMYYKDGNLVGFGVNSISNLENEDSDIIKITIPTNPSSRDNISFDQYKLILFEAYAKK